MRVEHVVSVFVDIYRPELAAWYNKGKYTYNYAYSREWTENRIEFFRKWTLESIRNQKYHNFTVLLLCAEQSRELMESYTWDANIVVSYDSGREFYESLSAGHTTITRLDSDDLMGRNMMRLVKDSTRLTRNVGYIFTSDYYLWLYHHGCFIHVTNPLTNHKWSPSYTMVIPKKYYSEIPALWYRHVRDICNVDTYTLLPPDQLCTIRTARSTHHAIWNEDASAQNILCKELAKAVRKGYDILPVETHTDIFDRFGVAL